MKKLALIASMLVTLFAVTACTDTKEPAAPTPNQPTRTMPPNPNPPPPPFPPPPPPPADQR